MIDVESFPADRYVRAARRFADLSQREMALRAAVARHIVVTAEGDPRLTRVADLARLLEAAGLHLIVVDEDGREFASEAEQEAARKDRGRHRYPAHLDVRPGKADWWGDGWPMFEGRTPEHTFDRSRPIRDWRRERNEARQLARDELRRDELSDLHRVQSSAFSEVVVADEESESAIAVDPRVLADATDKAGIGTGSLQGRRDVSDGDAGCPPEDFQSPSNRQRPRELGVDRQRMTGENRNPDTST